MMVDYQQEDRTQGRIVGGVATLVYAVLLVVLMLFVRFTLNQPPEEGEGLMINFGNVEEAAPGSDMKLNDEIAEARQVERQTPSVQSEEETLTQDFEEAPAVQKPKIQPKKKDEPKKETPQPKKNTQPPAEKPREVNRKALFPGRTAGSQATSEGTGKGTGNQGNLAGDPGGSHEGTGTGTGGSGTASLAGRSLVGALPRPDYGARDEGRVVIEITVDQQGRVTNASYQAVGSTTQNSTLVRAALRAARQARFNVNENAPISQRGTITYIFRMQ